MVCLILLHENPDVYVIATGQQKSVRQFIEAVAAELEMEISWRGDGVQEVGLWEGREIIKVDDRYYRPTEVESLLGDPSKAKNLLGWQAKVSFEQLVSEMVQSDKKLVFREKLLMENGYPKSIKVN